MCRLLKVSASGFYAWDERPLSTRARVDIGLTARIHAIHQRSRGAYGAPNIQMELADDHQIFVGKKRGARLMRAAGLRGVMPQRYVRTTVSEAANAVASDLVERQFRAVGPDQLWVADITLYLLSPVARRYCHARRGQLDSCRTPGGARSDKFCVDCLRLAGNRLVRHTHLKDAMSTVFTHLSCRPQLT
jgi:hypothetical protein